MSRPGTPAPGKPQKWNASNGTIVGLRCGDGDVSLRVLVGAQVKSLATMKVADRRSLATMCRRADGTGVGKHYVDKLLKDGASKFALVATRAEPKGDKVVGYAVCSVYNSYAGGSSRSAVPVTQRIVMMDLLCTVPSCGGLGQVLMRALVDYSKQLGASLLMLEAIPEAASFYERFQFRRVPDACAWPSVARLEAARRAFATRAWKKEALKPAAAIDSQLGGLWWAHYNREANDTVIMSLCLQKCPAGGCRDQPPRGLVSWVARNAASMLAANLTGKDRAALTVGSLQVPLSAAKYGRAAPSRPATPSTPPLGNSRAGGRRLRSTPARTPAR